MMIPVFRPSMGDDEVRAVEQVLRSGWIGLGPKTNEFEGTFAKYVGVEHAIAVNSCTAALHLALKVMNVEGGEVITTSMSFISTNHAILYNSATPVFADIEQDTLNISVDEINRLITNRTRAILLVHYGGQPCDMDSILEIAQRNRLKVIEDAAHACGAVYKGKKIGSIGDATCFSFHAVKNLATGDGGMITVHDKQIAERLHKLCWLGISRGTWDRSGGKAYKWEYDVEEIGYKCHMNDIAAAIGMVQLAKLDKVNARRREIAHRYSEGLSGLDWVEVPVERDYTVSAMHNYVIKVPDSKRDDLIEYLGKNDISASVHYVPSHLYRIYSQFYRKLPVTESVWRKLVTLPLYPDLTDEQVDYIINKLESFKL
jgi:perosamine synthetase